MARLLTTIFVGKLCKELMYRYINSDKVTTNKK